MDGKITVVLVATSFFFQVTPALLNCSEYLQKIDNHPLSSNFACLKG